MIIFDLETLADDTQRRHFIDPRKRNDVYFYDRESMHQGVGWYYKDKGSRTFEKPFEPEWQAYHEACDKDKAIEPVCNTLHCFTGMEQKIEIWSDQNETLRNKTMNWLSEHAHIKYITKFDFDKQLKMRPIGDDRPAHVIKEDWLNKTIKKHREVFGSAPINCIDMVFESDPECIAMYRRYGIFVFDCRQ